MMKMTLSRIKDMKFRYLLSIAAAALCVCACQKEDWADENSGQPQVEESLFSASIDQNLTKTGLQDDGTGAYDVVWTAGDQINVNEYNLTIVTEDQPSGYGPGYTKANFSGTTYAGTNPKYRALSPASLNTSHLVNTLPAEQTYSPNNIIGFPMYADSETESFVFKPLCGVIALNLKGSELVSNISLSDVSDSPKPMSGRFSIVNEAAVVSSGTDGVGLVCSTPVQLNQSTFTTFFIAVPAGSYEKLRIIVSASDGKICTLTSKKPIVVELGKITGISISSPTFKKTTSEFTYVNTTGSKMNKYTVGADASVFGDGLTVTGHTYDNATKTGVITLSGIATRIGAQAFNSCSLKSLVIPETVTELGSKALASNSALTSMNFPEALTTIGDEALCMTGVLPDLTHVTHIGANAFKQNTALSGAVTIPAQVDYIGNNAFQDCEKITAIEFAHTPSTFGTYVMNSCGLLASAVFDEAVATLPNGFFNECGSLTSVTFKGAVSAIGESVFYKCAFTCFSVPEGVTSIGANAFKECKSLATVSIPNSVETIGASAFCECILLSGVNLPQNANFKKIATSCFEECTALTSISIPSSVTSIDGKAFKKSGLTGMPEGWGNVPSTGYGSEVFMGCPIKVVTFPDSWRVIPNQFCKGWSSLEEVHFGSGVTTTGSQMFDGCSNLTDPAKCVVPANVTTLTDYTFYRCGITAIPEGVNRAGLTIGYRAFSGSKIQNADISNWTSMGGECFLDCAQLETVTLGSGMTQLPGNAFSGCGNLTSIDLSNVQVFGSQALLGCASLTSVNLSSATTINDSAFKGCTALGTVEIGTSITSIGKTVFTNDDNLSSITIRATSVPKLGGILNTSSNASTFTIYVPSSLISAYESATNWSSYAGRFQGIL